MKKIWLLYDEKLGYVKQTSYSEIVFTNNLDEARIYSSTQAAGNSLNIVNKNYTKINHEKYWHKCVRLDAQLKIELV